MDHLKQTLALTLIFLCASCTTSRVGVGKHSGFQELPFPSNTYASGQIVEIYSDPAKVELTFDPELPWDRGSVSPGWDISSDETSTIRANFATKIQRILEGDANYDSTKRVIVDFTDTRTRLIPKTVIFSALEREIIENESLKRQLDLYMKDGTHFDVITQTLSATVSFRVVDGSNQEIKLDTEVLKKVNSEFETNFKRKANSNSIISGSDLVVGIHYDPKMIDLLTK